MSEAKNRFGAVVKRQKRFLGIVLALTASFSMATPTFARFLQTDPVGTKDDTNLYNYARNDPVNKADPSGAICIPLANSSSPYCDRADFYRLANADPAIGGKTDYFKAVGAMTDNLANMDLPRGLQAAGLDDKTYDALNNLSQGIEDFNKGQIAKLRSGDISGTRSEVNRRLVADEQKYISGALDALKQSDPASYIKVISAMNRNANTDPLSLAGIGLSIANPGIMGAAQMTRNQLGRNIDFSNESDRNAMGNNMIIVYSGE